MKSLIKIDKKIIGIDEVNSVNARELWENLEIGRDFSNWIKYQIKTLGFEENIDYIILLAKFGEQNQEGSGGHNKMEYILTTDTAKHIAMASQTQKGKEVRNYFIAVEKNMKMLLENKRVLFLQEVWKRKEDGIIRLIDNEPLISHRMISLYTFTPERQILRLIKRVKNILERYNPLKFKVETVMDYEKGKEPITYHLDERQTLILLSYLNPYPSNFELREEIINGFMAYREEENKTALFLENKIQELEIKVANMKKVLA